MKKLLCAVLSILMLSGITVLTPSVSAATAFSDVEPGRWSEEYINYAVSNGYLKGVGDGKFDPAGTTTRAMVVTVLWRMEGSPENGYRPDFRDVPENEWYSVPVIWAKDAGVVLGVSQDSFDPNGKITREQLSTMLFRYSDYKDYDVTREADLSTFTDKQSISDWAERAMAWAVGYGLIKGVTDKTVEPGGPATREQLATILKRYVETFALVYNTPKIISTYTEKEYPPVTDADFFVSTTGSDDNDGSFEHPFATFGKSVEAVRAIPKTAEKGGIKVAFMAGEYGTLHVALTAEDSGTPECPVTYCKYGDGDVVFNNGLDLTADSFSDLDESEKSLFKPKAAEKIKKCDISSVFEKGLDKDTVFVFSDDWICAVARYPDKYTDGSDHLMASGKTYSSTALQLSQPMLMKKIAGYSPETVAEMKIYGYIIRGYRKDTFKAASYNSETGVLEIANWETSEFGVMRSGWEGVDGNGIQLCILDIPYELDAKDEYWIDDKTGTIYFFNPNGEYHIPVEGTMISMDGTNDIAFRGLSFRNTTGQFIGAEMSHGITIDECSFKSVSSTAGVRIYNCSRDRSFDIAITNSEFSCAYGASAYVNGRCADADRYMKTANVLFDNNLVRSSNLVYDVENAVDFPYNNDLVVTHNSFVHSSRGAVSFSKSYNVLIEYNDFDSVMINSEDGGAVYSNGNTDGRHIKVCHNFFNYMPPEGTGTFGYYVDDNTAGTEIYENLFYYAACPVMLHLGRDNNVHDNVFIGNKTGVALSNGHRSVFDEVGVEQGLKDGDVRKALNAYTNLFKLIDKYPEYKAGVEVWSPEVLAYHFDYDNMDDVNFVFNPVNTIKDNVHINNAGKVDELTDKYHIMYITIEGLRGYTLDENPFFVNPTVGDYRIKGGADIADIQFEKIGRY